MFRETEQNPKMSLFGSYNALTLWVGEDTLYAYLGREGRRIFNDALFRDWYSENNGRPCTPPWRLCSALLLQMYDHCSDQEAVERTKFDDRWKVALDLQTEEKPFAKSTLQEFRARLLLHEAAEKVFLRISLDEAKKFGLLKGATMKAALDTTPVTGRGAVKDTYNLVADGIKNLARTLSQSTEEKLSRIVQRLDLTRYFSDVSLKGGAEIDWSDDQARRNFLNHLVADARRLLSDAKSAVDRVSDKRQKTLIAAIALLDRLIVQDTEPDPKNPEQVQIKDGTTKDRIISVTDPDMKHGRKSASRRFDGHKLSTATDPKSGLITAVDVLPGNAPDNEGALGLVEAAEANTAMQVEKTIADCAYGDGANREKFANAGRPLVTKVPAPPSNDPFHKAHFNVDLEKNCVTCPAGVTTPDFKFVSRDGSTVASFYFPLPVCQGCVHKDQCLRSKEKDGSRTVTLHPQEPLLQAARANQKTPEFRQDLKERQKAEHRFAHLMHYGARQARYFGRAKVKLQSMVTVALVNFLIVLSFSQNPAAIEDVIAVGNQELPPVPGQSWDADANPGPVGQVNSSHAPDAERGVLRPDGVRGAPALVPQLTQDAPQ